MKTVFKSNFKEHIESLLLQKHALGYPYIDSERILKTFDRFCLENFPDETELTKEIGMEWAQIKPTEHANGFRNRLMPVRELAKYMHSIGINAFLIPVDLARKTPRPAVHVYTSEELSAFFSAADSLPCKPNTPARHLIVPVFFRILYCCGLRPGEARNLLVKNISLDTGVIRILESKGHNDRIVILSEELRLLCLKYDEKVGQIFPGRRYFFPSLLDRPYTKPWLKKTFWLLWKRAGITQFSGRTPTPYSFRHTFATNCLYNFVKEGRDVNACLPYLSAYMGHAQLSDTAYYIHLIPEFFPQMADMDGFSKLIPEVDYED